MASGNMKAIKRRIKSVGSTMQITKAMELVSSSKLRKAKDKAEAGRPYFEKLYEMMTEIAESKKDFQSPFTEKREIKNRLFIVIAGDRGLAGGYNSNLLRSALADCKDDVNKPKVIAIGKKAIEFFEKRDFEIVGRYPLLAETAKTADCGDIATMAIEMFRREEVDQVKIFYTTFVSPLVQNPVSMEILPIERDEEGEEVPSLITYDPEPEAVFNRIVPKFTMSLIYCALSDSYASEQSARRNAMENATDNAEKMIEELSLKYNRARQEKITNEINEIVSGANALQ
ncbi:MAG: ATP synthase F1 subunit gamma [Oscillospiraceae bacterium]|nr:ATP synthase F1 subunit gamma [Oscillospiraceae bacterium]